MYSLDHRALCFESAIFRVERITLVHIYYYFSLKFIFLLKEIYTTYFIKKPSSCNTLSETRNTKKHNRLSWKIFLLKERKTTTYNV